MNIVHRFRCGVNTLCGQTINFHLNYSLLWFGVIFLWHVMLINKFSLFFCRVCDSICTMSATVGCSSHSWIFIANKINHRSSCCITAGRWIVRLVVKATSWTVNANLRVQCNKCRWIPQQWLKTYSWWIGTICLCVSNTEQDNFTHYFLLHLHQNFCFFWIVTMNGSLTFIWCRTRQLFRVNIVSVGRFIANKSSHQRPENENKTFAFVLWLTRETLYNRQLKVLSKCNDWAL